MKVLSLFDGISCGLQALKNLNINVTEYHAFEIDKYAIQISKKNHPEIVHHGSVVDVDFSKFKGFDLLLGGFPCQSFSIAGEMKGFNDSRGQLFFDLMRAKDQVNPKYFLFENVKMKKDIMEFINKTVGVDPIEIDSSLVSAQRRKRLYWSNIPNITQPKDENIYLKEIIHEGIDLKSLKLTDGHMDWFLRNFKEKTDKKYSSLNAIKSNTLTTRDYSSWNGNFIFEKIKNYIVNYENTLTVLENQTKSGMVAYIGSDSQGNRVYNIQGKSVTLSANGGGRGAKTGLYLLGKLSKDGVLTEGYIRKLSPIECERLQTLPDSYTFGISDSQRYKCIGNGWTVKVIEHILKGI